MTKEEWKARKRANRRLKRQREHQERMEALHEKIREQAAENDFQELERLGFKNKYGNADPTAYYGILNTERPPWRRKYGF